VQEDHKLPEVEEIPFEVKVEAKQVSEEPQSSVEEPIVSLPESQPLQEAP
jgi:hypothetical protein